ncbi:helix-turn-helix domain-containing protein [Lactobacillus crispatus]|uniref:helix-turn-helix domain-containing protein n=1 Tax=Lactobacillus crispatus TaxID=47770 RepID=UPI000B5DB783|nr:helix-turn-helix transcriptional regulator [Lactobacillus crispatus]OXC15484.1 transcriptional regulator [Lactobacillus crispatus]OXC16701.1 transcriptional regulator [Lactobacillus crispatus]OXC16989.1 transcriptional regulator [Lactobacillus crispatus]OXC26291.1 transcriptional regulator [Lactobacillus crispatus]
MDVKYFGKRLMRIRKNRNLTQKEFANEIDVSTKTVSRYEHGLAFPNKKKLYAISRLLNVDIDYLLMGSRN